MGNNSLPQQLQKFRTEHQLSQAELAAKLYVSRQALSKWEGGLSEPSLDKVILLTQLLGITLDQLLLGVADQQEVILKLQQVCKRFDQPVLTGIDLAIHRNDRIALLGSNGAGKSTLVKIISGEIIADTGAVHANFSHRDDLDVMAQENVLIPTLKVVEQVRLAAAMKRVDLSKRWEALLKRFRLFDCRQAYVASLSGGQKRRLALLLSVLRPSKLLILDEPTVGMDLESIDLFWRLLEQMHGATLVVTHDFNQIDKFFTRVLLLRDGQIARDALVKTIHANNQTIEQWYRQDQLEGVAVK
ncbi:XRE family transcriptional regulator [Lactiplantibacillus modestisalitolerans]|uniref:ATP-binding cassette domain-containing protein n=1 Tax=Lactiplantibacillus modestisalitolerans TaxID=1457219 RepID=A0ABV5WRI5_9LACO|nr:XRE family transcriptional regulator [Lactiplantibacillus modestisalitolerans]